MHKLMCNPIIRSGRKRRVISRCCRPCTFRFFGMTRGFQYRRQRARSWAMRSTRGAGKSLRFVDEPAIGPFRCGVWREAMGVFAVRKYRNMSPARLALFSVLEDKRKEGFRSRFWRTGEQAAKCSGRRGGDSKYLVAAYNELGSAGAIVKEPFRPRAIGPGCGLSIARHVRGRHFRCLRNMDWWLSGFGQESDGREAITCRYLGGRRTT